MKKIILLLVSLVLLSGCATYKFQHGEKPYEKGYVVSRAGYTIVEYTAGKDNSVPEDLPTANRRFKRRHSTVEYYYKKMGEIENRFKETVVGPPVMALKLVGGILRLPFIAVSDYRYEHNIRYREKIKKMEQGLEEKEALRKAKLKEYLNNYIQKDLVFEESVAARVKSKPAVIKKAVLLPKATVVEQSPAVEKPVVPDFRPLAPKQEVPQSIVTPPPVTSPLGSAMEDAQEFNSEVKRDQKIAEAMHRAAPVENVEKKKERSAATSQPKAIITAKPVKGYSPLRVNFNGTKSYSKGARITSYLWDFGDGDNSSKPNPSNTYYSGSFDPKHFAVTLTVTDSQGNTDTVHALIKVLNK